MNLLDRITGDQTGIALKHFRGAVGPSGDLQHLLPPSMSWPRSLWSNVLVLLSPAPPLADITSKPVLARNIWGQYARQKRSWVMSLAMQSAAVLLLVTAASTKVAPQQAARLTSLVFPPDPPVTKTNPVSADNRGGGGGDHWPLPPAKGRLPKPGVRQFTPPTAVF